MQESLRIIDANLNRAREALRVVEEHARFVIEDAVLSADVKQARHDLRAAVPKSLAGKLPAARDIVGDVGTTVTTDGERTRASADEVAIAACKRATEALRTIEEYAKLEHGGFAAAAEALRYRTYELERRLAITTSAADRIPTGVYALLTETHCRGDWRASADDLISGGAAIIQLREKNLPDRELLARGRWLVERCRDAGVISIINDRPDLAAACGADGVHLGQDDLPISAVRRWLPAGKIVGISTHTLAQAEAAIRQAPDYVAVGPMFASETKPQEHIAGPETLCEVRAVTALPLVAIGGVTPENGDALVSGGATLLCACSALTDTDNVKERTIALCRSFGGGAPSAAKPAAGAQHPARNHSARL